MYKVIIAGGRDFNDYELLKEVCDHYLQNKGEVQIVSGKQKTTDPQSGEEYGADFLGEKYAKEKGYSIEEFPADWNKHHRAAGPIRNRQMAEYSDALIAFHDGKSKGTANMIETARTMWLDIRVHKY